MNRTLLVIVASMLAVVALIAGLVRTDPARARPESPGAEPLVMYCAASNRAVIEEIRKRYEEECGRPIQLQFGGSQTLLSSAEVSGEGDLYLPADSSYIEIARDKGLVAEVIPLARMQAVIAVPRGNPKGIRGMDDLFRDDVRLVQASPDATAVGKLTRQTLQDTEQWQPLSDATDAFRMTVTDVANDLLVGSADAGIVYDAVLHDYPGLEYVEADELAPIVSEVNVGVLAGSRRPSAALHFARYLGARDRGLEHYAEHDFTPVRGDVWSDVPELSIFAGSMLRPAIEETVKAFEEREGVQVTTVYNGCGILVGQMRGGERPDAYFACDSEFMAQVPDLFPESVDVSQNQLVILVQKGNPHEIASLQDLTRPGLRVGIGHEKQCAMGWLTQNTLREGGVQTEVMANVTVQTPTGDMLVNQMLTGSLDAAVVYLSNAAGAGDKLDAVVIQGLPCSVATQPFAIAPDSDHARTASRLFQQICSAKSQETFVAEGFQWRLETSPSAAF